MPLLPNEVKTENITNRAVTAPKIADGAISTVKLGQKVVSTEKIANQAVTAYKIGQAQVTTSRLKNAGVTTEKIATGAVVASKIADNAVTVTKLKSSSVITEKIADNAVTTKKLQDGAVKTDKIAFRAVTTAKIAAGAVRSPQLSANAVTTEKIQNGAVTPAKLSFTLPPPGGGGIARPLTPPVATDEIADASVTADKLATDSVTQTKIARNTVGWSEIREQSLEPEQIKTLSGEPPTDGQVPVYDESAELDPLNPTYWWFRWETPGAGVPGVTRPITPPIATDEIADGAVTPDKASAGFGRYVPRLVTGADFTLTLDYTWREIDLSGIVPAGARGVILRVERVGTKDSESVIITADRIAYAATSIRLRPAPDPDEVVIDTHTLPILADRILDYYGDADMSAWVAVLGWFI